MPVPSPLPVSVVVVSRAHRRLDVLATSLVTIGALLFTIAFIGLRRLHSASPEYTVGMPIEQLSRYYRLAVMSWTGLGIVVFGIAIAVFSWARHRAAVRAAD